MTGYQLELLGEEIFYNINLILSQYNKNKDCEKCINEICKKLCIDIEKYKEVI